MNMQMKKMPGLLLMLCCMLLFALGAAADGADTCAEHYSFSDGLCMTCGKPCAHIKLSSERSGRLNESERFMVNDRIHAYTYDVGRYQECAYCDAVFVLETTMTGLRREEEHSYEYDVCDECGYVNVCTHANTCEVVEADTHRTAEQVDERFHRIGYDTYTRTYCLDCGEEVDHLFTRDAGTMLEGHSLFRDEPCEKCGYVKDVCAHENVDVGYYFYEHYGQFENVTYNDLRHTVEMNVYASMICLDCGEYTEDVLDHQETITEPHWIDDGVCQVCGHDPDACKHEHRQTVTEFDPNWRLTVSVDDRNHKVYGSMAEIEICLACNNQVGDWRIIETNCFELYPHEISEDGRCNDCEYRIACRHPEKTVREWEFSERNARTVNDQEHVIYVDVMEETVCADCGIAFDSRVVQVGAAKTQPHRYSSRGVCSICEYVRGSIEEFEGEVAQTLNELKEEPVVVPTLVSSAIPKDVQPVYDVVEKQQGSSITYEISLQNDVGEEVELHREILLILPYPEEMDAQKAAAMNIVIRHYAKDKLEIFSTVEGTIDCLPQGLGIRVSSLSPFEIEWEAYKKGIIAKATDDLENTPVSVPTLVTLGKALPEGVELRYGKSESAADTKVVYDVKLLDESGDDYAIDEEYLLILPYPSGIHVNNVMEYDVEIIHHAKERTYRYSTVERTIEVCEQGMGVRISSLSPFEITVQEKPEVDLPQTGDESQLLFWMMTLLLAAAALGCRRAREN